MSAALRLPVIVDEVAPARPRTRGECQGGERPCPWVSCTEHTVHGLMLRNSGEGRDLSDDELVETLTTLSATCVLDVADDGVGGEDATLQIVGEILGVTRERVRQIEAKALRRVRRAAEDLRADLSEDALPAALAKPAKPARIDWLGEGDDPAETDTAPAAMGAEETHVNVNVNRGLLTPPAPGARCAVPGCPEAPQAYQNKLPPELRGLCSRHRQRAQLWRADRKDKSAAEALTWLLAHPEPGTGARSADHREAEAVAPVTVLEVVHREPVAVLAELDADLDVLEKASAKVSLNAAARDLEEQNAAAARLREERDLAAGALARVREELERDQAALRDVTSAAANLREENGWLLSQRDSARADVEALRDQLAAARADAETIRRDRDALAVAQQHAAERIAELEGQQLAEATYRTEMPRPLARLAALVKALAPARETVAFEIEESSSPGSWRCAVHRGGELLDSWHHDSETPDEAVGVLVQRAEDIARVRIDELRIALEGA